MKQKIIIILILMTSITSVYSRGLKEENQVEIAQKLLEEKKYNEAIAVLTTYITENPEKIYEVQPLLEEIRLKRYQNNEAMNELIRVLYEEENIDEGYKLIKEIEENNPFPDELSRLFIRDAREGATFIINQKDFKTYMDKAYEHLQNNELIQALDLYLQCFNFHPDEFDLLIEQQLENETKSFDIEEFDSDMPINTYISSLKNTSFSEVSNVELATEQLKNIIIEIERTTRLIDELLDQEDFDLDFISSNLQIFSELVSVSQTYTQNKINLEEYNSLFENISIRGIQSKYITYALLTLSGRESKDEGIIRVTDLLYPLYLEPLITKTELLSKKYYTNGRNLFKEKNYELAIEEFYNGIDSFNVLIELASLWNNSDLEYFQSDSNVAISILNDYIDISILENEYNSNLDRDFETNRTIAVNSYNEINILYNNYLDLKNNILEENTSQQDSISRIDSFLVDLQIELDSYINREILSVDSITQVDYIDIFGQDIEDGEIKDAMAEKIEETSLLTSEISEIEVYFGINNTDLRVLETFYPKDALEELIFIEQEYSKYIIDLEDYLLKFQDEKDYILSYSPISTRINNVRNALESANSNLVELSRYKTEAQNKIDLSTEAQVRAQQLYQEAVNNLNNEAFQNSRENITAARNASELSISYSYNDYIINELVPLLYTLEDDIIKEEARIVIRDVRLLITRGKELYFEGSYILASNAFREADQRWRTVNIEAHPEIPYWVALISAALDVESGRYLSVTEPLYSVLAGYLSFAEQNYRKAVDQTNKIDKLSSLTIAESYLKKVLEIRPLNERARYLQLLVLKEQDPDTFAITFNNDFIRYRNEVIRIIENVNTLTEGQINTAIVNYENVIRDAYLPNPRLSNSPVRARLERFYLQSSNQNSQEISSGRETINESYLRFRDLLLIADNSQRANVQRLISLCEVALGFNRLPVDTSNIRESNLIFTRALQDLNSTEESDIDGLNQILSDLRRALDLYPGNQEIPVVMDDILVKLGQESNFQLAPREDRLYREALKDFIGGRFFDARDKILDILRADPRNKNYPNLKDLISRVEVKIKEEIKVE